MGQEFETHELNIQPQAGVIGVFSRLNYKPWYAIAEFVEIQRSHSILIKTNLQRKV